MQSVRVSDIYRCAVGRNRLRRQKESGLLAMTGEYSKFDLREGDRVSHDGVQYLLVKTVEVPGGIATATVESEGGRRKEVKYSELRPLAVGRPVRSVQLEEEKKDLTGGFVFWKDVDGSLMGGIVVGCQSGRVRVHVHEGNVTARCWLPLWVDGTVYRRRKESMGLEPWCVEIQCEQVELRGTITATWYLEDATLEAARRMNLI